MNSTRFLQPCVLGVALLLGAGPVLAQSTDEREDEDGGSRLVYSRWSITPQLQQLNKNLDKFSGLIKVLNRANGELGAAFDAYTKNPNDELLASRVEYKLARYASGLKKEFDTVIGQQDVLISNMRGLNFKLKEMNRGIRGRAVEFGAQVSVFQKEVRKQRSALIKLARSIRNEAPEDPAQLARLKQKFANEIRKYRLQQRYQRGYSGRYKGYQRLLQYVQNLESVFGNLEGQFQVLVENLENERKYLERSIELQAEGIRMKRFVTDNIRTGEDSLLKVAEKIQSLYNKVDTFSQVHDRLNGSLDNFLEGSGQWGDLMNRISSIGGGPTDNASLDKLIEAFSKREVDEVEDDLEFERMLKKIESGQ